MDTNLILVNDNIFVKEDGNAFTVTSLVEYLKINNAKEIIVTGLLAEKCIYNTLLGGKELGNDMYVIPEAIIGKSTKSTRKALNKLSKRDVHILPLNEYCDINN